MPGYISDAMLAGFRGNYNLGVFFRLGTVPSICLSLSAADVPIGMPEIDPTGQTYMGAGRLLTIPALEVLINGIASTVSFSLQGVDPQLTSLMLDSAPEVLGAPVTVGIAPMDARWQPPASGIVPIWSGVADFLGEGLMPGQDVTRNWTGTLTLSAMSGDQARQLGNNLTFADATQQALFPGDTFFQRVVRYYAGQQISWPYWS